LQTVHLTPVPPAATSANQINLYVGRWFERLQSAIKQQAGAPPHVSEPDWLSISAEPAWNRKGVPLTYGFALTTLAAWLLLPQSKVPVPIGLSLLVVSVLLLIGLLWMAVGFLQANRALGRGDLDAVTSDEPPTIEPGVANGAAPLRHRGPRIGMRSFLGIVGAAVMIPVGVLLWEACVFPSFGERIFGKRAAVRSVGKLVIDAVPPQFGPESHDARQFGGQVWNFKCLVPPDHLAQMVFVHWTNGTPLLQPGLSAYFKTGHVPADVDCFITCEPQASSASLGTNALMWNVNLGLGYTSAALLPVRAPFRMLDTAARMTVLSGHQRQIRLLDSAGQEQTAPARHGVELRVLLEPLKSSAARSVPSEKELNNCIGGAGFELPMEEVLKLIKRLPTDP
jgi:hypothetical protein